jgi:hypothetical protein
MNRSLITSLAAAATVSLAALAYGAPPDPSAASATSAPKPTEAQSVPPEAAPSQSTGAVNSSTALERIVPGGMTPQQACSGFSKVSDCALTLHLAQNLNLSFADLKSKLAGGQSLIAAISEMKPGVDPQAEVTKADAEARSDMYGVQ